MTWFTKHSFDSFYVFVKELGNPKIPKPKYVLSHFLKFTMVFSFLLFSSGFCSKSFTLLTEW